jgi:hypothetical protein
MFYMVFFGDLQDTTRLFREIMQEYSIPSYFRQTRQPAHNASEKHSKSKSLFSIPGVF